MRCAVQLGSSAHAFPKALSVEWMVNVILALNALPVLASPWPVMGHARAPIPAAAPVNLVLSAAWTMLRISMRVGQR